MDALVIVLVFAVVALMGAAAQIVGSDSRDFDTKTIHRTTNLGGR